uniref:CER1 n=1 Tax=Arundo donax TaxID=35708 RepID=A0A0A9AZR5_ARUDO
MARPRKLQVCAGSSVGGTQHVQVCDEPERGERPAQLRRAAGAAAEAPLQPALDHRLPPPDGQEQAQDRQQEPRLRPGRQGEELGRPDHPDGAAVLRG